MTIAHNLGFPAIGALRELKRATEGYWSGKVSQADLLKTGAELRARHWRLQRDAGLDLVPCNDFSYYDRVLDACRRAYGWLADRAGGARLLVATYFAGLGDNLDTALALPTHGLHVDLVRAPGQLEGLLKRWSPAANRVLSLGAIDGRNVWRADLQRLLPTLERARDRVGPEHLWLAPSCSLLHVPIDLALEKKLDPEIRSWLAYAKQKLEEVVALRRALDEGAATVAAELDLAGYAANSRRTSPRIHDPAVKQRVAGVTDRDLKRTSPHAVRRGQQVRLPLYPTTTIGSFPQTAEVRKARKELGDGAL